MKPTVFNYQEYERVVEENKKLKAEVANLLIRCRIAEADRPIGEWIQNDNGTWLCNQCHSWIPDEQHYYARYCLYCGAKMGGDIE